MQCQFSLVHLLHTNGEIDIRIEKYDTRRIGYKLVYFDFLIVYSDFPPILYKGLAGWFRRCGATDRIMVRAQGRRDVEYICILYIVQQGQGPAWPGEVDLLCWTHWSASLNSSLIFISLWFSEKTEKCKEQKIVFSKILSGQNLDNFHDSRKNAKNAKNISLLVDHCAFDVPSRGWCLHNLGCSSCKQAAKQTSNLDSIVSHQSCPPICPCHNPLLTFG
jgi:hypothetical protein